MRARSDEELLRVVTSESADYTPDALATAREELSARGYVESKGHWLRAGQSPAVEAQAEDLEARVAALDSKRLRIQLFFIHLLELSKDNPVRVQSIYRLAQEEGLSPEDLSLDRLGQSSSQEDQRESQAEREQEEREKKTKDAPESPPPKPRNFFDRLLGRKAKVEPKVLAYAAAALALSHGESLAKELGEGSDDQWTAVTDELLRAYFALATLHAGRCIHDTTALNRYGAAMLDALRLYPEAGGEIIRPAFADELAVDYCVRLYVQGRPDEEDLAAARECADLLRLDFQNALLMLCAYAHVRSMRSLGIGDGELRFVDAWLLNSSLFIGAFRQFFGKLEAVE